MKKNVRLIERWNFSTLDRSISIDTSVSMHPVVPIYIHAYYVRVSMTQVGSRVASINSKIRVQRASFRQQ